MPLVRLRHPVLPPAMVGWVLLDDHGRPRYWSTIWAALDGASLADSTLSAHLAVLEQFYQSVARQFGGDQLDRLITTLAFDQLESSLEGFFLELNNRMARERTNLSGDWRTVYEFVAVTLRRLVKNDSRTLELDTLQARLLRLENLYASLNLRRPRPAEIARALPSEVIEDLYRLIDPTSSRNPFRTPAIRWRNFVLVLMLLHQGLRRGEALVLAADALKSSSRSDCAAVTTWLDVVENPYETEDPRYQPPQLKNTYAIRQIPVAPIIASAITTYRDNYRPRATHSYLFGSQAGHPLSMRMVNEVFHVLSRHLAQPAQKVLRATHKVDCITPHDLRHTCATVRIKQFIDSGDEMEIALQKMRVFFGWSRESQMPLRYSRAYFETRLATIWNDSFDAHVDALRSLQL